MRLRELGAILKSAGAKWRADNAPRMSAALAFYTIFSLAPLLLLAVAAAGLFFPPDLGREILVRRMQLFVGHEPAQAIGAILDSARQAGQGPWAVVLSAVLLAYSATGVLAALHDAMNVVWNLKVRPGKGWFVWALVRQRLLAVLVMLVMTALLLATLVWGILMHYVYAYVGEVVPKGLHFWRTVNIVSTFAAVYVLFAVILKVLPDAHVPWRSVLVGALLTAGLFAAGSLALGAFLGWARTASAYGAAQSVVVFLLWVYYSGMIFLFGAEFTRAYTLACHGPVAPSRHAIWGE